MYQSSRSTSFRTQMVALAAGAGMLLGSSAILAPTAMAKPPLSDKAYDLSCQSPRGVHPLKQRGNQIITVDGENSPGIATAGGTITVNGYGFIDEQINRPGFKINDHSPEDKDGEPFWPNQPESYGTEVSSDGRSLVPAKDSLMPNSDGEFAIKFKLPEAGKIGEGKNWIRTLSANPYFSHFAFFLVVSDEVAQASKNTRLSIGDIEKHSSGKYALTFTGSGFTPGADVNLEYNCASIPPVEADEKGDFTQKVLVDANLVQGRVDRQLIAREYASGADKTLVKAAVAYNTQTPGGSVASVKVPEAEKTNVADGSKPTQAEIDAVLEVARKYVPGGDTYTYNKDENRIEIFTAGNNQTRFYELSIFANVGKSTTTTTSNSTSTPNTTTSTPTPTKTSEPQPEPQQPGSSPMMGILIALLALLGLGGAGFAAWNWARSQGLIR